MEPEPDKVEQVLQRAKDRYRFLAENVTDVALILDLSLCYAYCSPPVEPLRGFTVEEAMPQALAQALTSSDSYRMARKKLGEELARERAGPGSSCESWGTCWTTSPRYVTGLGKHIRIERTGRSLYGKLREWEIFGQLTLVEDLPKIGLAANPGRRS